MLQKEDNDWVKKCREFEVEDARPRGRPQKTWREIVGCPGQNPESRKTVVCLVCV